METLIISASLNPDSHSRAMARAAERALNEAGERTTFLDLREHPLPLCDGDAAYDDPRVDELAGVIKRADAILVAVPIYNYDVNAAAKNLVELTGSAWEGKAVGFVCAAGGRSSYMSVMGFANDLMLDFRCLIVPRFVYAVDSDFEKKPGGEIEIVNAEIVGRIGQVARETRRLGEFNAKAVI